MRDDSAEILSVPIPILIKNGYDIFCGHGLQIRAIGCNQIFFITFK